MSHVNEPAASPSGGVTRSPRGADRAALTIHTIADIAAGILILWILMYVLEANQANGLVSFVQDAANWLAGWSQDLFTMETDWLRVLLNYGIPAGLYLLIGHKLAARLRGL
ncbi:hypothetical protein ABZW18_23250 [Streptomyces sp. NPDC004647]|uniref:hypothetical protein n=1 Tax=Streptomyces sp. NPDC004647 TaxID=3154671 RepID=UPI0033BE5EB6